MNASAPSGAGPKLGTGPLYLIWGALGFSILVEFGLLLFLQRAGSVEISDRGGGALGRNAHVGLAAFLWIAAAVIVARLRAQARAGGLSAGILAWALAEGLAVLGFVLAYAIPPVPRLALTIYFTGALALWLWSRPTPRTPPAPSGRGGERASGEMT